MPDDPGDELFDVCNAADAVIGQAPRRQVHAQGLLHRAAHIWVFDFQGRLLVHLRSASKDEFPLCYTSSASGHLAAGEDYPAAAARELQEELGLSGELEYVTKLPAAPETANEHTVLFRLTTDQPPIPDPEEISSIEFLPIAEWASRVAEQPDQFTPPFRTLLAWYLTEAADNATK